MKRIAAAVATALAVTLGVSGCSTDEGLSDAQRQAHQRQWDKLSDDEKFLTCVHAEDGSLGDALRDDPATADTAGEYVGFLLTRCIGEGLL